MKKWVKIALFIIILIEFYYGFINQVINFDVSAQYCNNDITIYRRYFFEVYPKYLEYKTVVYLPYFLFILYPFSFFTDYINYILISHINLLCLIIILTKEYDKTTNTIHYIYFALFSWYFGVWGNFELLIYYLNYKLYHIIEKVKDTPYLFIIHGLIFSLINFKIYSFIFIILYIKKMSINQLFRYIGIICISQLCYNTYFLIENWNIISISLLQLIIHNPITDQQKIVFFEPILRPNLILPILITLIQFKKKKEIISVSV